MSAWNDFVAAHAGQGLSMSQLSLIYKNPNYKPPKPAKKTKGAIDVEIKLDGQSLKRLWQKLSEMPSKLERKVTRSVMGKVATAYLKEVRKLTPQSKKTGTYKKWHPPRTPKDDLRKSLTRKPSSKWKTAQAYRKAGVIGITAGHAYRQNKAIGPHAHLVNKGHSRFLWGRGPYGRVAGTGYLDRGRKAGVAAAKSVMKRELTKALREAVK